MKAWVLHDIGDFCLEEREVPRVAENEVLVQVKAAGICGSDISRIYQTGAYHHPLIPGHEFSGVVVETGVGTDKRWKGKRVGIFPLIPCKACVPCKRKQYEMCRSYSYLGSRRDGGFAEYVSVPVTNLIELPDSVSFIEAAMLEPMAVAVHAMRRGVPWVIENHERADAIVVCGLGTIGILLLMLLWNAGMENLLAIGNKEFQKEIVLSMGLPEERYCDSRNQDVKKWLAEHTGGLGVGTFFECVGKNETLILAIDNAMPGGHVCLVGNPYSNMEIEKAVYWKILRNQLVVTGTWNSSFTGDSEDDWHYALKRLADKQIKWEDLVSHEFSMEDLEKGFHIMRDKTEDYVKIMVRF